MFSLGELGVVCSLLSEGGLGIHKLRNFNPALLRK